LAILDCESYDAALQSINELYCTGTAEVIRFLRKFDLEGEYVRQQRVYHGPDDFLRTRFESAIGKHAKSLEAVCWFHLTRVPDGTTFSEGILPLPLVRAKLWDTLGSIVANPKTKANLEELRDGGFNNLLYNNRILGFDAGPFGVLIREAAFHPDALGTVDYLRIPETIEDICNGYKDTFGRDISEEILAALKKCIVKFESAKDVGDFLIGAALVYCWCKANSVELDRSVIVDFDGEGVAIPRQDIKNIEFV
jgi:hypothetical protein